MSGVVGAYACPRGVFAVEFQRRRGAIEVMQTFGAPGRLDSATDAARQLVGTLTSAGIRGADVAIAIRGFDLVHHILEFPPARDDILTMIVTREMARLEPQLADPLVAWMPLPAQQSDPDAATQRQILAVACPRETPEAFETALKSAGHKLLHLTALPAAVQRLDEELIESTSIDTSAIVAPLPDGAFIGFFLGGAVRLIVEPPLADGDDRPDPGAIVEEVELGAMFVRQQFRGAQVERLTFAQGGDSFAESEARLGERLGAPVRRLDVHGLSAAALAAVGAVLDAQAARPLALAGAAAGRVYTSGKAWLKQLSTVAVVAVVAVGVWATFAALSARDAAHTLRDLRRQVEQESFGIAPIQATAEQRKVIRDAVQTLRVSEADRVELQNALAAIGGAVTFPVRLDSLHLDRGTNGWIADLGGSVVAESNGRAVQALHDFHRALPERLSVQALSLDELKYEDVDPLEGGGGGGGGISRVRFRLSFELPTMGNKP